MFGLNWFPKWNKDNPTDIYGPAILVGATGGAVFIAAMLIAWGYPFQTTALQTGPRGTGMDVIDFAGDTLDPTAAAYAATVSPPVPPAPGAALASANPANEPALGNLTQENYDRLVNAMRAWTGIPDLFAGEENYQTITARSMIAMVQTLNSDYAEHVGPTGVNCYTCHRGQPVPSGVWFRIAPVTRATEGWASVQNRATAQSGSTSLPSDALENYLLEYNAIAVHDLESRVAGSPSGGVDEGSSPVVRDAHRRQPELWAGLPSIQNTERTYSLMNYFDNSLGVNCVFCHNTRAFYDPDQHTPQWATAQLGIGMVQEINNTWLLALEGTLPPERLGPVHGDVPKAGCNTCHKGYSKPMNGLAMTADWPELMSADPPVYQ
jgi:photosynthetic reaction center cytochrome c subunit